LRKQFVVQKTASPNPALRASFAVWHYHFESKAVVAYSSTQRYVGNPQAETITARIAKGSQDLAGLSAVW